MFLLGTRGAEWRVEFCMRRSSGQYQHRSNSDQLVAIFGEQLTVFFDLSMNL